MVRLAWLRRSGAAFAIAWTTLISGTARADDDPELIFKKTTVWRALSPNAKLATYVIDDPGIEGVACYFTVPEVGGWKGWAGFWRPSESRVEGSRASVARVSAAHYRRMASSGSTWPGVPRTHSAGKR